MQIEGDEEALFMVDSNVLLSGLYYSSRKDTPPHKIINLIKLIVKRKIDISLKLFFPKIQLDELIEVVKRKIDSPYDRLLLEEFFKLLYDISDDISTEELLRTKKFVENVLKKYCLNGKKAACDFDPDDIYIISAALSANVRYFITGDKKIHSAFCRKNDMPACINKLTILYPSVFVKLVKEMIQPNY